MNYKIIATGSEGNALYIEHGDIHVLIDCGVPYKAIAGLKIDLVFLTHIHSDHFKTTTIKKLAYESPKTLFICEGNLIKPLLTCGVNPIKIHPLADGEVAKMSANTSHVMFARMPLHHDVPNSAWRLNIYNNDEGVSIFYATDTGDLDGVSAPNCDYYFIEANYAAQELLDKIKEKSENGEYCYEMRVAKTHLSKEQASKWLADNAGENSTYVWMHEHTDKRGETE